jgi:hypothetical protein
LGKPGASAHAAFTAEPAGRTYLASVATCDDESLSHSASADSNTRPATSTWPGAVTPGSANGAGAGDAVGAAAPPATPPISTTPNVLLLLAYTPPAGDSASVLCCVDVPTDSAA